jgi:hypothetical protein
MYLFFTEDDSVQISLSEPSPFKGFLLKPSSLKAPSIRLPQSKATHEEPAESIVLTGFKTHSTPDSNVFGRLGSGKSEPSDQNSDLPSKFVLSPSLSLFCRTASKQEYTRLSPSCAAPQLQVGFLGQT